jgi:hypothetical protein
VQFCNTAFVPDLQQNHRRFVRLIIAAVALVEFLYNALARIYRLEKLYADTEPIFSDPKIRKVPISKIYISLYQ